MMGDPHFYQFNGFKAESVGTTNNHMWMVKSSKVKIQGLAWESLSWSAGVAVSGPFIQNQVLMAYNSWDAKGELGIVTWNGKKVLTRDGVLNPMRGVELMRTHGSAFLSGTKKIESFFSDRNEFANLGQMIPEIKRKWSRSKVYRFRLPDYIEVYVVFEKSGKDRIGRARPPGADVLIKMSPSASQKGVCSTGSITPVDPEDDMFLKAGLGKPQFMELASHSASKSDKSTEPNSCQQNDGWDRTVVAKCAHIKEAIIRDACIFDACASGSIDKAVEAANDAVLLRAMTSIDDEDRECKCS